MPVESVSYVSDLNASWPLGTGEPKSFGDDHLRNIKLALKNTFPNLNAAVTSSPAELNYLDGATGVTGTGNTVRADNPNFGGTAQFNAIVAASGLGINQLHATNITAGTVADARLSSNVPLKNAANAFTAAQTVTVGDSAVGLTVAGATGKLQIYGYSSPGSFIDSLNAAGNAFTELTLRGSQISTNANVTATHASATVGFRSTYASSVTAAMVASSGSAVYLGAESNHPVGLITNNTERLGISAAGNFDFKGGAVTRNNGSALEVGYAGVPINSQGGAYTCVLADANKTILANSAGTKTIPANASVAYPPGTTLTFVNRIGAGTAMTIAINSDAMLLAGVGTSGSRTLADDGIATALKVTNTIWMISGAGLS
jgi:hypothetical protein